MTDSRKDSYILGLDLGVQSAGWAKIPVDTDMISPETVRLGVRCFDGGTDGSEDDFKKGKDTSPNTVRRGARQTRRQLSRRRRRLVKLFNILKRIGLFPPGDTGTPEKRQSYLNWLDSRLMQHYFPISVHAENQTFLYKIRALGLDTRLTPEAFGRVLYHLAQRRGFLSNKKAVREGDDEEGKVKQGISDLQKEIEEAGSRTLGEYFAAVDPEKTRIRQRYTSRKMRLDEFELLWEIQASFDPERYTDRLKQELHRAVFFQRPLKSQKHLIGKCRLEEKERCIPISDPLFQKYRYWQRILDLRILSETRDYRPLTWEEQDILAENLEITSKLTFKDIRSLLNLKQPKQTKEEKKNGIPNINSFNFEIDKDEEKGIIGNRTRSKLAQLLDSYKISYTDKDLFVIYREIGQYSNEEALAKRFVKLFAFDEELAKKLSELTFEQGYASLSKKALNNLLPVMTAERIPFAAARKKIYGDQLRASEPLDLLPPVSKAFPDLKNPAVTRALTEVRKVVNLLIKENGKPAYVKIELARDLKKSRKQRENIAKENDTQAKRREKAVKEIIKETGIQNPNRRDIEKYLLADECGWICPYTGKQINFTNLFGVNPTFDIEHIIPFSRSLDNSFANKTLCFSEENRHVKKNNTPYECYHGNAERWNEILTRVKHFRSKSASVKLKLFQKAEISEEDFSDRMLNDTRYISKLASEYLGLLYGGVVDAEGKRRVQVSPGRITAWLRNSWELNSILAGDGQNEKNRSDHRHHAIDALVIALTDAGTVNRLTRAALAAEKLGERNIFDFSNEKLPVPKFLETVRGAVNKINISYRIDRKVSGPIHEGTNYSPVFALHGFRRVRKPLESLSPKDIDNIADPTVKAIVKKKLEEIGGDPQKFAPGNFPVFYAKSGRIIPIKKVRVNVNVKAIPFGGSKKHTGKGGTRFAAPGNNHHLEIVAVLDQSGNEIKWEGIVVPLYEAYRRVRSGEPVVQRDHGPNKRFKFSLGLKEYFTMPDENGVEQLYIVRVVSENQKGAKSVESKLHNDARTTKEIKKTKGLIHQCGTFMEKKIKKVRVDPLGNISPAND